MTGKDRWYIQFCMWMTILVLTTEHSVKYAALVGMIVSASFFMFLEHCERQDQKPNNV